MVLQYKPKNSNVWKDYPGKNKLKDSVTKYDFRLLNHDKTKILVEKTSYAKAIKRMRQIEFFKHRG